MTRPVYLVDDDDAVRQALTLLLSTVDIPAVGFADPQAFLAQAPKLAPGCLILDIRMPVVSFRNGAADFLSKPIDEQDLIDAIQKCQEALELRLRLRAEKAETLALLAALTPRERDVLDRVAEGFTTRQIAEGLGLSPRTVESHRAAIGTKLGTTSQAEMTRFWLEGRETP
ncbi:MAG: response regulator transcription factor [Neoaquamicrobium sediminum]|uniref:response regulator transcription factor n=1 Tax=Neoaquamicrobium sediminum TaxID=1849104 RepID=UPI004036DF70